MISNMWSYQIPRLTGISAVLNGAKILFFAVLIFAKYHTCSLSSVTLSHLLISILWEAKNFKAFPHAVVSGFPNITQIFILIWLINTQIVHVFARTQVNFLNPWDIILACNHMYVSHISHSTSAFGTKAATESITMIFTAHVFANSSAIWRACSPWSGCYNNKLSISTQSFFA